MLTRGKSGNRRSRNKCRGRVRWTTAVSAASGGGASTVAHESSAGPADSAHRRVSSVKKR